MKITDAIDLLKSYKGPDRLTFRPPASEELIAGFEQSFGVALPGDFKTFYRFANGFEGEEDMFNMISLEEIHVDKSDNNGFPIAEYMIYSDSWELQVNPLNENGYVISYSGLELTHSLGEFIGRFLKGGVLGGYGLYFWHDEMRAKHNGPSKPEKFARLLAIFRWGLINRIIEIEQVKDWADHIVLTEEEPDYFFMELSMAKDANGVIALLDTQKREEDVIFRRVLFGLIYNCLIKAPIAPSDAMDMLYRLNSIDVLTYAEFSSIINIEDAFDCGEIEAKDDILVFLEQYKSFSLFNYDMWECYNRKLEEEFSVVERDNSRKAAWQALVSKERAKPLTKSKAFAVIGLLAVVFMSLAYLASMYRDSFGNPIALSPIITLLLMLFFLSAKATIKRIY
ncbi:SMI1/KNR4 family protein [Mucilaginibacter yixingensis]|nr:SMI1/KNR4 family protein [Mucilaginibacter yixingensis]